MTKQEDDFFENEDYFLPFKEHRKPQELSPEEHKRRQLFYQKMAYIEMRKLRPKHPHV